MLIPILMHGTTTIRMMGDSGGGDGRPGPAGRRWVCEQRECADLAR